MNYIWMAVTADKLELPIFIEESAALLGEKIGITAQSVYAHVRYGCKKCKGQNMKLVRTEVTCDD